MSIYLECKVGLSFSAKWVGQPNRVINQRYEFAHPDDALNYFAKSGWELIFVNSDVAWRDFYFRRPIDEAKKK
jgi:hypothetical protein